MPTPFAPSAPSRPVSPVSHPASRQEFPSLNQTIPDPDPDPDADVEARLQRKRPSPPGDKEQYDDDNNQLHSHSQSKDDNNHDESTLDNGPAENESLLRNPDTITDAQVIDGTDEELDDQNMTPNSPWVMPWDLPDDELDNVHVTTNKDLAKAIPDNVLADYLPSGRLFATQFNPAQHPLQIRLIKDSDVTRLLQQATQVLAGPAPDLDTNVTQPFDDEQQLIGNNTSEDPDSNPKNKRQRVCEHGRGRRSDCKDCVGACPHDRLYRKCHICRPKKSPTSAKQAKPIKPRTAPRDQRADEHAATFFSKLGQQERLREANRLANLCVD